MISLVSTRVKELYHISFEHLFYLLSFSYYVFISLIRNFFFFYFIDWIFFVTCQRVSSPRLFFPNYFFRIAELIGLIKRVNFMTQASKVWQRTLKNWFNRSSPLWPPEIVKYFWQEVQNQFRNFFIFSRGNIFHINLIHYILRFSYSALNDCRRIVRIIEDSIGAYASWLQDF